MAIEPVIRPAQRSDVPAIKSVVEDAELFPPEMLADMIAGYEEARIREFYEPGGDKIIFWKQL